MFSADAIPSALFPARTVTAWSAEARYFQFIRDLEAVLDGQRFDMVRKLVYKGLFEFFPEFFGWEVFIERGERAVINNNITPHLVVNIFTQGIKTTRRIAVALASFRQEKNAPVQISEKFSRELFRDHVKGVAYFFEGKHGL